MRNLLNQLKHWMSGSFLVLSLILATSWITPVYATFIVPSIPIGYGGNMNSLELFVTSAPSGVEFEGPGATNLSLAGWTAEYINPHYVLLTGPTPAVGEFLYFDYIFTTTWTGTIEVVTIKWPGAPQTGDLYDFTRIPYLSDGSPGSATTWSCSPSFMPSACLEAATYDRNPAAVTEPSPIALLSLGLAGLGFARRKKM